MSNPNRIDVNQMPFDQFKRLGLEKKDVLSLPPQTLTQLLSGKRTNLITFQKADMGNGMSMNNLSARLSLAKDSDGNTSLNIHPYQPITPKTIEGKELSPAQTAYLKSRENPILELTVKNPQGFEKQVLVQYDKQLNDYHVNAPQESPEYINGFKLSEEQKKEFSKGREITTPEGPIRKDFNSPLGYQAAFLILGAMTVPHLALATLAIIKTVARLRDTFGNKNQQSNQQPPAKIIEDPVFTQNFVKVIDNSLNKIKADNQKIAPGESGKISEEHIQQLEKAVNDYKAETPSEQIENSTTEEKVLGVENEPIPTYASVPEVLPETKTEIINVQETDNKITASKNSPNEKEPQKIKVENASLIVEAPKLQPKESPIRPIKNDNNIKSDSKARKSDFKSNQPTLVPSNQIVNKSEAPKSVQIIPLTEGQINQLVQSWSIGKIPKPELTKEQLASIPDRIDNKEITLKDKYDLMFGKDLGDFEKETVYRISDDKKHIERFSLPDYETNTTVLKNGNILENEVKFNTEEKNIDLKELKDSITDELPNNQDISGHADELIYSDIKKQAESTGTLTTVEETKSVSVNLDETKEIADEKLDEDIHNAIDEKIEENASVGVSSDDDWLANEMKEFTQSITTSQANKMEESQKITNKNSLSQSM